MNNVKEVQVKFGIKQLNKLFHCLNNSSRNSPENDKMKLDCSKVQVISYIVNVFFFRLLLDVGIKLAFQLPFLRYWPSFSPVNRH